MADAGVLADSDRVHGAWGPIMAIYQARFLKYLHNREMAKADKRKVWCFLGDGGNRRAGIARRDFSLAGREKSSTTLVFVVNCNLQRLDGPVRGNGKIIQELEGVFRRCRMERDQGDLGSYWDPAAGPRYQGPAGAGERMEEALDGATIRSTRPTTGAYVREHFFGAYDELKEMVARPVPTRISGA